MINYCKIYSCGGSGTSLLQSFLINDCEVRLPKSQNPHVFYPPKSLSLIKKAVYIYANPMDMITCFFKNNEKMKHNRRAIKSYSWASNDKIFSWAYKHCRGINGNYEEYYDRLGLECTIREFLDNGKDYFLLEEHFDDWIQAERNYPIAYVKYESLLTTIEQVLLFVGVDSKLSEKFSWKNREANWKNHPVDIQNKLIEMYGSLNRKMDAFPPFLIR